MILIIFVTGDDCERKLLNETRSKKFWSLRNLGVIIFGSHKCHSFIQNLFGFRWQCVQRSNSY